MMSIDDEAQAEWADPLAHATAHAEGQAALVLCESLLYALAETGLIGKEHLAEAIDVALSTKQELAAGGSNPVTDTRAAGLLASIQNSLRAK